MNKIFFIYMTLEEIKAPIETHFNEFNTFFKEYLKSDVALLDLIIGYITRKKGKQVRPLLVLLSAELCGGVNKKTYVGAAMVELLHTATLVHDDVVDKASIRRGIATINAEWNNKIAVLIGDFLLAKGLLASIDSGEFDFLRATSNAVRRMSEGELRQIQKSMDFSTDEETYFRIIADKTASLLASCCEIGAISSTTDKQKQYLLRDYGEYTGIAFQIRDDIFDFKSKGSIIGKPVGNDLKEKKITLPLLFSLRNAPPKQASEIKKMIKDTKLKAAQIKEISKFVIDNGGIDYAESKARFYSEKAQATIVNFVDCPAKRSLIAFSNFVIERQK